MHGKRTGFRLSVCLVIVLGLLLIMSVSAMAAPVMVQGVPWYQQTNDWMCGPASLQMVFDFYGPNIDQREIGFAAGCIPSDSGTSTAGMIRASHFSDLSTIDVSNCKIVGYTGRGLGYAAFSYHSTTFWLDGLKALIDKGYPVIVSGYWGYETSGNSDTVPASSPIGHFRVVVGYDDATQEVIINDPWGRDFKHPGDFQGTMSDHPGYDPYFTGVRFSYEYFKQLWSYNFTSGYNAVFVAPWHVDISATGTGLKRKVVASVTYPCPAPFDKSQYPASNVRVALSLPAGLTLAKGETATKSFSSLSAGGVVQATWNVVAASTGSYDVSVVAQGLVSGAYVGVPYTDRIGGEAAGTVVVGP